jgi:hyaluronoglucosaminidase
MPLTLSAPACGIKDRTIVKRWCERSGWRYRRAGGEVELRVERNGSEKFTYVAETAAASDEVYELTVEGSPPHVRATIVCSGDPGLRYGLNALHRKANRGDWRPVTEYDYPRFPVRGIVEGYYGKPWSPGQRLDMLRFIASRNMNTYLYAPKDDPYHRDRWNELYDEGGLRTLRETFREADALGLRFWYGLAPGLSMRYSDPADYEALLRKTRQIFELGVRDFALLLDDIPDTLQHPEDQAAFPDLAVAHARLANRYYGDLRNWSGRVRLAVCPTCYWGKADGYYITRLGTEIDARIDLFWTGRNICSQELTAQEAAAFARQTFRPPLYWDNYPVNDLEMADELHIGPYRERDPNLFRFSRGIIANGMALSESSKIAFSTIADYAWNPQRYDPEVSWREALEAAVGPDCLPDMLTFADNVRYSCLYPADSPRLAEALNRFRYKFRFGNREEAVMELDRLAAEMAGAAERLRTKQAGNPALFGEIERWLKQYARGCAVLKRAAAYCRAGDPACRRRLQEEYDAYLSDRTYVFADVLSSFVNRLLDAGAP